MSMKDKKRWMKWVATCSVVVALTGCSFFPQEEELLRPPLVQPAKENFTVVEVKRGNIEKKVRGVGTLTAYKVESLFFKESGGRLKSINVNLGDEVKKGDVLVTLDSGDLDIRIRQQRIAVEKAQIALQETKEDRPGDERAIRLKMLDLESVQIQLDNLLDQLRRTQLVSDIDGIVSYVEQVKEGDSIAAFRSLITISDPTEVKLVYQVSNYSDLIGVELNMEADVTIENKMYKGRVVQVPTTAPQSDNKAIQDRNSRSIVIDVIDLPEDIKIGTHADISILTEYRENVLIIPRVGLRSYLGRDYVQVLDGESRKEVDVQKGIVAATEVEIYQGLEEGQQVILNN